MRIAVYSHYYLPEIGAPSARIGDFASSWLRTGHEVHVATCFPNHPTGVVHPGYQAGAYRNELLNGVHVHRNWTYITPNKGFLKKTIGHASFWLSTRWNTGGRMPPPDCVIGTSPTFFAAMAAAATARRHRVPFVMEVRDLWPAIFTELGVIRNQTVIRLLELWELALYRRATRVVTVTESFRRNLISRGVPAGKVVTITNGADTDYWTAAPEGARRLRAELGLDGKFVVLYIGAHGISQGLGSVVKAAGALARRDDIEFLFVGEGAEKQRLLEQASALQLRNLRFIEPVGRDGVRDFYSMADLCLVPLRNIPLFDTFIPSKMFEIMSVGRPILASLRGEAAEILQASGAATVVEPESAEALTRAIEDLAGNREATNRRGAAGRAFVQERYSRAALAARYVGVMQEACAERGGRAFR